MVSFPPSVTQDLFFIMQLLTYSYLKAGQPSIRMHKYCRMHVQMKQWPKLLSCLYLLLVNYNTLRHWPCNKFWPAAVLFRLSEPVYVHVGKIKITCSTASYNLHCECTKTLQRTSFPFPCSQWLKRVVWEEWICLCCSEGYNQKKVVALSCTPI